MDKHGVVPDDIDVPAEPVADLRARLRFLLHGSHIRVRFHERRSGKNLLPIYLSVVDVRLEPRSHVAKSRNQPTR